MLIPLLYYTMSGCVNIDILNNADLLSVFYSIEIIMVSYVWNIDPVKKGLLISYKNMFFDWSRVFLAIPNESI